VLGRNFEYKGEDPFLAGKMAVAEIKAVQAKGVIAMAKHFVANEQETNRTNISETIDTQVLHELYLLPFEMAVKDGEVASLMCSYNDVNGKQACENDELLTNILRDQWGFKGYVQSDFFAVKSTATPMLAGLDHLMPVPSHWTPEKLDAALDANEISIANIDTALARRYTQMFKMGIFGRKLVQTPIDFTKGGKAARRIGVQSAVLLQNNGALPFASDVKNVVVIGKESQVYAQQAVAGGVVVGKPMGAGGGSSDVVPNYTVAPVDGIRNVLKSLGNTSVKVSFILVDDLNNNIVAAQTAARAADAVIIMAGTISEEGADRATFANEEGVNAAVTIGDGLDWYTPAPNRITTVTRGDDGPLNPEKNSQTTAMIKGIMQAAPNISAKTVLVLKDNAGIAMPRHELILGPDGPSIVEFWFPGQEDGNIVANLLLGVVNPSGKLPVTFPMNEGEWPANTLMQYPGVMVNGKPTVTYSEGLNIGYRWYDAQKVKPRFPFGYGLSYTSFALSKLLVSPAESDGTDPITVTVEVKNTGKRAGAEVVQVYVAMPVILNQPPKRLINFEKVTLKPGEKKTVTMTIDPLSASHPLGTWNVATQQWLTAHGNYQLLIGNSSGALDLSSTITINK
jgi:beta-glucosidase